MVSKGYSIVALISLFTLLIIFNSAMAEIASETESQTVCENWLYLFSSEKGDWAETKNPMITEIENIYKENRLVGRCYSIEPTGWIVVPIIKSLPPIYAYSECGNLDLSLESGLPQYIKDILDLRIKMYDEAKAIIHPNSTSNKKGISDSKHRNDWDIFSLDSNQFDLNVQKNGFRLMAESDTLLKTRWHQGPPFNNNCPQGNLSCTQCPGNYAPTYPSLVGCVATAVAQIMKYWEWPISGTGSKTYYWNGDQSCDGSTSGEYLTADFSNPYDWDNMLEHYENQGNEADSAAVAELCYEVGVACEMDYGVCASSAYGSNVRNALRDYFNYQDDMRFLYREDYSAEGWFIEIMSELVEDPPRPIYYSIRTGPDEGHAIVIDGFRTIADQDQYHVNYGWGQDSTDEYPYCGCNAWFTVDEIYGSIDDDSEIMLTRIMPDPGDCPYDMNIVSNLENLCGGVVRYSLEPKIFLDGVCLPPDYTIVWTISNCPGAWWENSDPYADIDGQTMLVESHGNNCYTWYPYINYNGSEACDAVITLGVLGYEDCNHSITIHMDTACPPPIGHIWETTKVSVTDEYGKVIQYSDDGDRLAIPSAGIYDTKNLINICGFGGGESRAFSPTGDSIAVVDTHEYYCLGRILDCSKLVEDWDFHGWDINVIVWNNIWPRLAVSYYDPDHYGEIKIINPYGSLIQGLETCLMGEEIYDLSWREDKLAAVGNRRLVTVWETNGSLDNYSRLWCYDEDPCGGDFYGCDFNSDGTLLAAIAQKHGSSSCTTDNLKIFNASTGSVVKSASYGNNGDLITDICWSPDDSKLLVIGEYGSHILDANNLAPIIQLVVASGYESYCDWSAKDQIVVIDNSSIKVFTPFDQSPPSFSNINSSAGEITHVDTTTISGEFFDDYSIEPDSVQLNINSGSWDNIFDTSWSFAFPITLLEGENVIALHAADRMGHWVYDTIRITYEPLPQLEYVIIEGPDTLKSLDSITYNCVAYYSDSSAKMIDPCLVEWNTTCDLADIDSCGFATVGIVDSAENCTINMQYSENDITVDTSMEISITPDVSNPFCLSHDTLNLANEWWEPGATGFLDVVNCGADTLEWDFHLLDTGGVFVFTPAIKSITLAPGDSVRSAVQAYSSDHSCGLFEGILVLYDVGDTAICDTIILEYDAPCFPPELFCHGPVEVAVGYGDMLPDPIPIPFEIRSISGVLAEYCFSILDTSQHWIEINEPICDTGLGVGDYTISITNTTAFMGTCTSMVWVECSNCQLNYKGENERGMGCMVEVYYTILPSCNIIYVSTLGSDLTGDGSEINPYQTVQHAIDVSNTCDTIYVMPGTYNERFMILGKSPALISTSGPASTFLNAVADRRVITISDCPDTVSIVGLDISGGASLGDTLGDWGAGILTYNTNLKIDNCMIHDNIDDTAYTAYDGGGGIFAYNSYLSVENCEIYNNSAAYSAGGGIYFKAGSYGSIKHNYIHDNFGSFGGGIMASTGATGGDIEFNVICNNISSNDGGGIYLYDSAVTGVSYNITNNTITNNIAAYSGTGINAVKVGINGIQNIVAYNCVFEPDQAGDAGNVCLFDCGSIIWNCNDVFSDISPDYCNVPLYCGIETIPDGNITENPLFCEKSCGLENLHLSANSPCAADNPLNPCGGLIGVLPVDSSCGAILDYIVIEGMNEIPESTSVQYQCHAYYTDYSDRYIDYCDVTWSHDCQPYGEIDNCGEFTTFDVSDTVSCQIFAEYTEGDITRDTVLDITIYPLDCCIDVAEVAGATGMPVGVPVLAKCVISGVAGVEFHADYDASVILCDSIVSDIFDDPTPNCETEALHFIWDDFTNPVDLSDSDTLMVLWFTCIGGIGDTGWIYCQDNIEFVDSEGEPIPDISCCNGFVYIPPCNDISGNIVYYDSATAIPDVNVDMFGNQSGLDSTDTYGDYYFECLDPGDYTTIPSRISDDPGVSVSDIIKIRRLLAHIEPFDNIYKCIAADVNCDCRISVADVIKLRRYLAHIEDIECGNWRFIDADYIMACDGFCTDFDEYCPFPESIFVSISGQDIFDADFIGIRIGDVNNTWTPTVAAKPSSALSKKLEIKDVLSDPGEIVALPIAIADNIDLAGIEMHLKYDSDQLNFMGVQSELPGEITLGSNDEAIHIVWENIDRTITASIEEPILFLDFKVKDHFESKACINFTGAEIVDEEGQPYNLELNHGVIVKRDFLPDESVLPNEYCLEQNRPNPFNPITEIRFGLPEPCDVSLEIFNIMGQKVKTLIVSHLDAGFHSYSWDASGYSSGIYFTRLKAGVFTDTKKMILLK